MGERWRVGGGGGEGERRGEGGGVKRGEEGVGRWGGRGWAGGWGVDRYIEGGVFRVRVRNRERNIVRGGRRSENRRGGDGGGRGWGGKRRGIIKGAGGGGQLQRAASARVARYCFRTRSERGGRGGGGDAVEGGGGERIRRPSRCHPHAAPPTGKESPCNHTNSGHCLTCSKT